MLQENGGWSNKEMTEVDGYLLLFKPLMEVLSQRVFPQLRQKHVKIVPVGYPQLERHKEIVPLGSYVEGLHTKNLKWFTKLRKDIHKRIHYETNTKQKVGFRIKSVEGGE